MLKNLEVKKQLSQVLEKRDSSTSWIGDWWVKRNKTICRQSQQKVGILILQILKMSIYKI